MVRSQDKFSVRKIIPEVLDIKYGSEQFSYNSENFTFNLLRSSVCYVRYVTFVCGIVALASGQMMSGVGDRPFASVLELGEDGGHGSVGRTKVRIEYEGLV